MRLRLRISSSYSQEPHTNEEERIDACVSLADFPHECTLAELWEQVAPHTELPSTLWVDYDKYSTSTTLRTIPLHEGSLISPTPPPSLPPHNTWLVCASAGTAAGTIYPIIDGQTLSIGRSPQADIHASSPSTSWIHASLQAHKGRLYVYDMNSSNGTFLDGKTVDSDGQEVPMVGGTLVTGGVGFTLYPRLPEAPTILHSSPHSTIPFNRPPRPGFPVEPEALDPPSREKLDDTTRFSWITILAPLIMAAVMVLVMGNIRYALFALMSPLMAIGTWVDNKRRAKKEKTDKEDKYREALEEFKNDIEKARTQQRHRYLSMSANPALAYMRTAFATAGLWARRSTSEDSLNLLLGFGSQPWQIPLSLSSSSSSRTYEEEVEDLVRDTYIADAPININLDNANVLGVWGEREEALALIRSLVIQTATGMGPADINIGVFADENARDDWAWAGWLEHTRMPHSTNDSRYISFNYETSQKVLDSLRDSIDMHPTPRFLLVVDSPQLVEGRDAPARFLAGYGQTKRNTHTHPGTQVSAIFYAPERHMLPASCTWVLQACTDSQGTLETPSELSAIPNILLTGITCSEAENTAANLARLEDPETESATVKLPRIASLLPLLGLSRPSPQAITKLWQSERSGVSTPIGISEQGTFMLDIVRDGPHGLVGGTTGSGKSEFLRSLIAGLAARYTPEELTFILVDFKGGAAFASLERLPHTIGTLSNLEPQLALRAVKALEAEMRYRQTLFTQAGADVDNIDAYMRTNPDQPLPRLLFVVDEFAQLAHSYPDVLSSLVSIAAVGRTLGVHMVLATQRPAGVVNNDILANTNLRVALRVQSKDDSSSVISTPAASSISRDERGRAYLRLGETDILPIQTALVTGSTTHENASELQVYTTRPELPLPTPQKTTTYNDRTDLDLLIDAITQANEHCGYRPPRPVWPEDLPNNLHFPLPSPSVKQHILFALSDDPDNQRQIVSGWDMNERNILFVGIPGSGTSTALSSLTLQAAQTYTPEELDIILIDLSTGDLAPLARLPHTTAHISQANGGRETQLRATRLLQAELSRRLAEPEKEYPTILVVIDGLSSLKDDINSGDLSATPISENLARIWTEGPDVGIYCAASASRHKAIHTKIADTTTQKWVFRLGGEYASIDGLSAKDAPPNIPGRCVINTTHLQTHVATPHDGTREAVARIQEKYEHAAPKKSFVAALPTHISTESITQITTFSPDVWQIPVGVCESDLSVAYLESWNGEHITILGPARSGKSTLLISIAEKLRHDAQTYKSPLNIYALAPTRSPLSTYACDFCGDTAEDVTTILNLIQQTPHIPSIVLIDNVTNMSGIEPNLATLLKEAPTSCRIFAALRPEEVSGGGKWITTIRSSRLGILLNPPIGNYTTGDFFSVKIPSSIPVPLMPGRGFVCTSGSTTLAHMYTHIPQP